jgi:hypothetical protein
MLAWIGLLEQLSGGAAVRTVPIQDRLTTGIFVNICMNLPFAELHTLMLVCRRWNMLLSRNTHVATQVWRIAREHSGPYHDIEPPPEFREREYAELTLLRRGCMICGSRDVPVRILWVAAIRACQGCALKNVIG